MRARFSLVAQLLSVVMLSSLAIAAEQESDLRGVSVGITADALPVEGFAGFTCVTAATATEVSGWQDWKTCPANADGLHALRFRYAAGDTKVAGHPVVLTALFDNAGRVVTLRIETEAGGPLYLRKKAFLLGLQARHRYGDEGWTCTNAAPSADQEPVGGVFMKETCRKVTPDHGVVVSRTLFHRTGGEAKDFVSETQIVVTAIP